MNFNGSGENLIPTLILQVQKHLKCCLHLGIQNHVRHWEDALCDLPDLMDRGGIDKWKGVGQR